MVKKTSKAFVPEKDSGSQVALPTRWIAELQGETVGGVELTPRGKYKATDQNGRRVGVFLTLSEARESLENFTTRRQRMDQSRTLLIIGLIAFVTAAIAAAVGIVSLLNL